MSDPRVDLLAKHIASVLVTLIDIARDGETIPRIIEPQDLQTDEAGHVVGAKNVYVEDPPKTRGRPRKAESAPPAADSSASSAATTASEPGTATEAGTPPTGEATTAEPDTLATAQELTIKLVQTKGRDAAVGALSDFNVAKASALAADQIGAYCEAVRELLSA